LIFYAYYHCAHGKYCNKKNILFNFSINLKKKILVNFNGYYHSAVRGRYWNKKLIFFDFFLHRYWEYSIVYGSILPPFPNNWASIVGCHGRWLPHFSEMVLPPHPTLPPTPFHAQWARPVNCQNREIRMHILYVPLIMQQLAAWAGVGLVN
jgi:hypothetical protein